VFEDNAGRAGMISSAGGAAMFLGCRGITLTHLIERGRVERAEKQRAPAGDGPGLLLFRSGRRARYGRILNAS